MINMQTNHVTSCMDFIRSMAQRYNEMANAPEILTNSDRRSQIENETREMHKMHMQGASIKEVACKYDLTYNIVRSRFSHRKLQINRKNKRAKK